MEHISEIMDAGDASRAKNSDSASLPTQRSGNKRSVFSNVNVCPCGRCGRLHVCLLGTGQEPDLCPRCGGLRRYVAHPELHPNHRDYYADCDCAPRRRLGDWQARQLFAVDALRAISQAPQKVMTFDNFDPDWPARISEQASLREALELTRAYAADPKAWALTLTGTYGCGKTHLGRAMELWRNDIVNGVAGAAFVVAPDLLDYIKATFGRQATESYDERFDKIRNAPFLILDDIGAEKTTDWVDEKLFQIFNYRYNRHYPTVVLSNYSLEELEQRIVSRLYEGTIHTITAGDYRRRP